MHEEVLSSCTSYLNDLIFNFYLTEVSDKHYFPPFPKSAVMFLLCACAGVILNVGFANMRPDFEKLKMEAENYLKKKISLFRWESLVIVFLLFFLWIVE